jgi:hypothetical protein
MSHDEYQGFFDSEAAADYLGLSKSKIVKARGSSAGPAYHKFGRRVLYRREDLDRKRCAVRILRELRAKG